MYAARIMNLLLLATCLLPPATAQALDRPPLTIGTHVFQRRLLSNGLSAVAVRDEQETVSVFMVVGVGGRQEDERTTGLAHLVEHAMFAGTPSTGADVHEQRVESWGGESNAFTREDSTLYYDHAFAAEHLEQVLGMEADRLRHLGFDEEAVLHERHRLEVEERHTFQASSGREQELEAAVFRTHPYRAGLRDRDGLTKAPGLPVAKVKEFYDRYYHPNNVCVVVVGPGDELETLAAIERAFEGLPRGPRLEAPPPEPWFEARSETIPSELAQDRSVLTWLIPELGDPSRPALELLAHWIDRQELSDGSAVKATAGNRLDRDLFQVSSSGDVQELLALVASAREDGIDAVSLAEVRASMGEEYESLPMRARPYFSLAGTFGVFEVAGRAELLVQRKAAFEGLGAEQVAAAAQLYLTPARCVLVRFEGTGAETKPLPTELGELYSAAIEASEIGDFERAIEAYTRMLAKRPNKMNTVIYLASRGQVYLERKDFDAAIADFEAALEVIDYPAVRELLKDSLARRSAAMRGQFEERAETERGAASAPSGEPKDRAPESSAQPTDAGQQPRAGAPDADLRADLLARVEATKLELEAWRGLRFLRPVEPEFVDQAEDEKLGGWYEPESGRLVVVMGKGTQFSRGTQLHELFHALQDQAWDLSHLHEQAMSSDETRALQGLIEGEAMLAVSEIMNYDFEQHAKLPETGPIERARFDKLFHYGTGQRFVRARRGQDPGGWAAVNRTWGRPPRTTAELYHPERALPEPVDWSQRPLEGELLSQDQLGELELRWWLVRDESLRSLADELGSCWRGDRRVLLRLADGSREERWELCLSSAEMAERLLGAGWTPWWADGWSASRDGRFVQLSRPAPDQD